MSVFGDFMIAEAVKKDKEVDTLRAQRNALLSAAKAVLAFADADTLADLRRVISAVESKDQVPA